MSIIPGQSWRAFPNKDKHEIADKLKEASDDEMKMQELAKELRDRGYDPAAETIDMGRSRPVGAFPGDQSRMRLSGYIIININEEWFRGKKYLMIDVE